MTDSSTDSVKRKADAIFEKGRAWALLTMKRLVGTGSRTAAFERE